MLVPHSTILTFPWSSSSEGMRGQYAFSYPLMQNSREMWNSVILPTYHFDVGVHLATIVEHLSHHVPVDSVYCSTNSETIALSSGIEIMMCIEWIELAFHFMLKWLMLKCINFWLCLSVKKIQCENVITNTLLRYHTFLYASVDNNCTVSYLILSFVKTSSVSPNNV